jgi:hypothetical protein
MTRSSFASRVDCSILSVQPVLVAPAASCESRLGLFQSEETLTETALYNIAIAHQGKDIVIDLATKRAEGKHGADWEWSFAVFFARPVFHRSRPSRRERPIITIVWR